MEFPITSIFIVEEKTDVKQNMNRIFVAQTLRLSHFIDSPRVLFVQQHIHLQALYFSKIFGENETNYTLCKLG